MRRFRHPVRLVRWAALGGALVVAVACALPAPERHAEERARAAPRAEHGIHADRLRELMRGLDALARERLPQALDLKTARADRAAEVAAAARAVADSARRIPDAAGAGARRGADEDRSSFAGLAGQLERRARALAEAAEAPLDEPALRARFEALGDVCDRCHAGFRAPRSR